MAVASLDSSRKVRQVAIVGTGIIGSGWAALFLAKGYAVKAFVRSPASQAKFLAALEDAWGKLVARKIATEPEGWKAVVCVFNLAECICDADYVQESVVEELELKQLVIKDIDQFAPEHVIIGSSTSFIPLSLLRVRAGRNAARVATVHPTIPHWDAFCEVLGASPAVTAWLATLFGEGLGLDVVVMKREKHGHVLNSLFMAVCLTAGRIVRTGVADAAGVDRALVHLGRNIVATGGLTGMMVGLVGGGSTAAMNELNTDILLGMPMGLTAEFSSRILPAVVARPTLRLLQVLWWPMRLLRAPFRAFNVWFNRGLVERWEEFPHGYTGFIAESLRRIRALDQIVVPGVQH